MIKLISACNSEPAYAELARISQASIRKYCRKHSLKYAFYQIAETERAASWYKIKFLKEELERGDAEYCLWLDADTLIYNRDFDLRTLTRSGKEIYVAKDDLNINCGVLLLKNSALNRKLLDKIWGMTHCLDHPWWEQQALVDLIQADYEGIRERIEYVPQKTFNAYIYGLYGKRHEAGEFDLDSFVVHFPGMPLVTRHWKMTELSKPKQAWKRRRLKLRRFLAGLGFNVNCSATG
ncbi:MAG TPA: hypothetical protein VG347_22165 [Verrucomicrobiae bacterium]|nr:hypothetical protein [Verrucomicrobiae bacterium]